MNRLSRFVGRVLRSISVSDDGNHWSGMSQSFQTIAGVRISPESALGITAVFSAISVIATDTASLPIGIYQRRADGGRDEVRSHPNFELLNVSPDDETTAMRWRQALMGHTLGWGNGTAEIEFDGKGYPAKLHMLHANTRAERDLENPALFYRLPNGVKLPPRKVLHVAGLGYDGVNGYSPVALARQALGLTLAAETFGSSLFGNGAIPRGILKYPRAFKEAQLKNLRESLERIYRGAHNGNRLMLLEEGVDFQPSQINPDDAQFLATRAFQILEIARMFRVPPHKIGDYSQAHLANVEESNLDYMMTTLLPWCEQIEQAINFRLFTKEERAKGLFAEHNLMAFLRGNMVARAEFYTKLRDLGVLTPNQICRFENLNPIGAEGDIRLVPLNMTSLKNAGKPSPAAPVASTPKRDDEREPINAAA